MHFFLVIFIMWKTLLLKFLNHMTTILFLYLYVRQCVVYDLTSLCFEMSNKYHRVSEGRCWQASLHSPLSAPQSVVPIWSLSFNWLRDTWIVDSTENFISTSCYSTAGSDSGNYRTPPHQRPGHLFVFLKTHTNFT